jgi:hypothetical protein
MLDKEPSAIITVDGNERKIYQGQQIYLNDGENFEIRFFNPLSEKIGIEIVFNNQKKNEGLLVLRPGEDITLDRFLGEKKKMKYETYTIDGGSDSAVKAAALNGLVEFKFFKEKQFSNNFYTNCGSSNFLTASTFSGNLSTTTLNESTTYGTSGNLTNTSSNFTFRSPGIYAKDSDNSQWVSEYKEMHNLNENVSDNNINYKEYIAEHVDKSIDFQDYVAEAKSETTRSVKSKKLETGRIEKGPESKQELKTVDAEFDSTPFHTITYQLKPSSQKPVEVQEIRQYCTECGYRLRKESWKFCPRCGEKM